MKSYIFPSLAKQLLVIGRETIPVQAEKIGLVLYDTKNFHDVSHYEYNKRNTLWKLLCTVFCQQGLKPLGSYTGIADTFGYTVPCIL